MSTEDPSIATYLIAALFVLLVVGWVAIMVRIAKKYSAHNLVPEEEEDAFDAAKTLRWHPVSPRSPLSGVM